jgi:acyl-CoA thioesterase I
MRISRIIIGLIAVALVALSIFSFVTVLRPATNNPRAFLKRGRRDTTKKVIVCLGDSLTHATISGDYVALLQKQFAAKGYEFVNAGINGNTTHHLLQRLNEVIACKPDIVTILIGTNDINASRGARERAQYLLPYVPTLEKYLQNLNTIVTRLKTETDAHIILLSPPPLGEDIDSELNRRVAHYSAGIQDIAEMHGAVYVPLFEELCKLLEGHPTPASFRGDVNLIFGTAFRHFVERKSWDELAAENGFRVLTDFIHLNDRSATLVARLIAAEIA